MIIFLYCYSELLNKESDGLLKRRTDEAPLSDLNLWHPMRLNYRISLNFLDACTLPSFVCLSTSVYTMCVLL
jgi:hypothetical protein